MSEVVVEQKSDGPANAKHGSAADPEGHTALTEDLLRLRGYLERRDVDGARAFVRELEQRWPDAEPVKHLARVLAPPASRPAPEVPHRSFRRENEWLRAHAREYPGCWIAVFEDRLIAADPDLDSVVATVRQVLGRDTALLHYQPGRSK
jgi:hypothetical protein